MAPLLVHIDDFDSNFCALRTVGVNLSTRMVIGWHRAKAKVNRFLDNAPPDNAHPGDALPETHTAHEPTYRLLHEIVEMIIAHLADDYGALKACSLTCRSWYTIAVLHLHHTLTLEYERYEFTVREGLKPLSKLDELGLIPRVKEIRVLHRYCTSCWFMPQNFSRLDLRYFSAFTNVHTLCLQEVDISRFMPGIKRYFGHFSPTLRSIELYTPRCTPRQLSYFLSLFPNLDDIVVRGFFFYVVTPDTTLVPFSTPRLRGRLKLLNFHWTETWTYLITSCDGLRFRHMDLWESAGCASTLFEACAETLETLRFHVTSGSPGKRFCMVYL